MTRKLWKIYEQIKSNTGFDSLCNFTSVTDAVSLFGLS